MHGIEPGEVCNEWDEGCSMYRGKQDHTRSGKACAPWHWYAGLLAMPWNKEADLYGNSYCRSPRGITPEGKPMAYFETIWCFTDFNGTMEFCDPLPAVECPSGGVEIFNFNTLRVTGFCVEN